MKNILLLLFLFCSLSGHAQIITTIAGQFYSNVDTILGDGGLATDAIFLGPYDVILDGKGNYYITDGYDNRIRKVDAAGIITTIAGNDTSGYNGDGIPATAAQLYRPNGIICDHYGNIYFADALNNRVRKIDTSGIITTVAGNGSTVYNGDNIPADSAAIFDPHHIAFDLHGNMYITEYETPRVRKVSTAGIITTIAGTGIVGYSGDNGPATAAKINGPYGIVLDDTGNIYFADVNENVVRKIDTFGIITTFAGNGGILVTGDIGDNGPADAAMINSPAGLTIDPVGNIYIAQIGNRIRMIAAGTNIITTLAGDGDEGYTGDGGPATAAELNNPTGVAVDATGNLYIADFSNSVIRYVAWPEGANQLSISTQAITLYPNPATTSLTITATNTITNITISNVIGQTVYSHEYNDQQVQVNVADLSSGLYFVKINGSEVVKFVKQ